MVTVSSKGQIVIPEEMRRDLAIKEGSKLLLVERAGKITMEKEENALEKLDKILSAEEKEKLGWLIIAEHSLAKAWSDPKEDEVWAKYL